MVVEIFPYAPDDQRAVIDLILPIQQDEFGIAIAAKDQSDLMSIPDFYQSGRGNFWVARHERNIVGTIGLKDIGNEQAALRKMFVSAGFRGREFGIAGKLLDRLLAEARERGIVRVFLGTTDKFLAAHRFYEKNGFEEIAKRDLPENFPVMDVDTKFYNRVP